MIKKIFTPKIVILVVALDILFVVATPWKYFQESNGYCAEDWTGPDGGPLGLMVCEHTLNPLGKALLVVAALVLVLFLGYLLGVALKKLFSGSRNTQ